MPRPEKLKFQIDYLDGDKSVIDSEIIERTDLSAAVAFGAYRVEKHPSACGFVAHVTKESHAELLAYLAEPAKVL